MAPSLGGESFGMVLTRAFACALPVVASDIPGYREVTTPETSVTCEPGEPGALADAVAGLLDDEPRRVAMGFAARALAVERYSWDDIARRLEEIYASASQDGTPHDARGNIARNPWARGILVLALLASALLAIWWRGPEWGAVVDAFDVATCAG